MLPVLPLTALGVALAGYLAYTWRKDGWMPARENLSRGLHHLKTEMTVEARAPYEAQPVWYAGMIVEPAEFAQQLANLQTSLHRANTPVVRGIAAEMPQAVAR